MEMESKENDLTDWSFRKSMGLTVVCLAVLIESIDITLLNVGVEQITNDLHTDIRGFQWILTLYALVFGALTLTGGRLGDIFGRRKIFILGGILFGAGSYLASIATDLRSMLIGEAVVEGIGAAFMAPCGTSIIRATFKKNELTLAFGLSVVSAAVGLLIGPLIGGWLTTYYSWRLGFQMNVGIAFLLAVGSLIFLDESRNNKSKPQLDFGGVLLSTSAIIFIVFGIIESTNYGWWKATHVFKIFKTKIFLPYKLSIVPVSIMFGLVLMVFFVLHEQRRTSNNQAPLISLSLFKIRQFSLGTLTTFSASASLSGLIFALPIYFQGAKNLNALEAGLRLLPSSLAVIFASLIGVWLKKFWSPKTIILGGLTIFPIGIWSMHNAVISSINVDALQPGLVIAAFGMGLILSHVYNLTLSGVPVDMAGEATGISSSARQIGSSFGSAIIGTAFISQFSSSLLFGVNNSQVVPPAYKDIANSLLSTGHVANFADKEMLSVFNAKEAIEIKTLLSSSIVDGVTFGLYVTLLVAICCFLIGMALPRRVIHLE